MAELSRTGEFVLIHLALMCMARKHAKNKEGWGFAAIAALERAIGDGDRWAKFTVILIRMMSAPYRQRRELYELGCDLLHDILADEFPEVDDGIRYTKEVILDERDGKE